MKLSPNDIKLLTHHIKQNNIRVSKHPEYELYLYKYTQACVFNSSWDKITLMCRGLALDNEYNIIANCIPKFFNIEELSQERIPKINLDQPFTATVKEDGSLIQMFNYKGKIIITSSGGFCNDYTKQAEEVLNIIKYDNSLKNFIIDHPGYNFIFELISPLTRVVISYDYTTLKLITIRDTNGNEPIEDILQFKILGMPYVNQIKFNSISELLQEKESKFNNREGYVLTFKDGSRVKVKYDEYFTLHKLLTKISKKFVWETLSNGIALDLENIPDEAFKDIERWSNEIQTSFSDLYIKNLKIFNIILESVENTFDRKQFANYVISNYKEYSNILFALYDEDENRINKLIWKHIEPKEN